MLWAGYFTPTIIWNILTADRGKNYLTTIIGMICNDGAGFERKCKEKRKKLSEEKLFIGMRFSAGGLYLEHKNSQGQQNCSEGMQECLLRYSIEHLDFDVERLEHIAR